MKQRALRLTLPASCFVVIGLATAVDSGAVLEGAARDAVSGQPIAGVKLTLFCPSDGGRRASFHQTTTDENGAFRWEGLEPCTCTLASAKAGYAGSDYAASESRTIRIDAGASRQRITLLLNPTASIEGTITGESGEVLPGVDVSARHRESQAEVPSTSGPDGAFRLEGLLPGEQQLHITIPLSVRRGFARRDPGTGEVWGYIHSQYYPGVDQPSASVFVTAPAGLRTRADISLRRSRLVELSGKVVDSITRNPVPGTQIELDPDDDIYSDETFERRPAGTDGRFRFELIQPGHYHLLLFRGAGSELPYAVPLEIGTKGASDATVMLPENARIETRLKLPEGARSPAGSPLIVLDPGIRGIRPKEVPLRSGGVTILDGVPPGSYRIAIKWDGANSKPADWYVSGLQLGTQDALQDAVMVTDGANGPLAIEFSGSGGRIAGRIVDSPEQAGMLRMVSVHPAGQPMPARSFTLAAGPDGRFLAAGLAPGEYFVSLVWTRATTCSTSTAKVKVERGMTSTVQLEVCRAARY
ncbi:MAG: carboxypeptidase regulatory-like domain-containing protein [Acidobacteria bacterium]|nr:carboxypeptidase regulatory-like domain-containing protein [Acidobacteriota bacterium]